MNIKTETVSRKILAHCSEGFKLEANYRNSST